MEFVIAVLTHWLKLSQVDATESMLTVHFKGSAKFGRMRQPVADELSSFIGREMARHNYPFRTSITGRFRPRAEVRVSGRWLTAVNPKPLFAE
ncbi:MAG: ATP-dependent Clp protease adaptor ClpS [Gammaproteobacteria bacterium]|nr:ATP-dependent Clp protease adaptor ClpS [Gammaproteobacteria bacterium]